MTCPLARDTSAPCPRKSSQPGLDDCQVCLCDLAERSAIIQYGGAAATRAEADRLAVELARAAMPGFQREIG